MKPLYTRCLTLVLLLAHGWVLADSLDTLDQLNQSQFLEFSENLAAATHYKAISPPEPLGLLGFDVGLEVSSTDIRGELFDLASGGEFDGSELIIPRVHVHKGLPFGLDIGASLGIIPDTDARIIGAEIRYAVIPGGVATPAVGLRASYSTLEGLDQLEHNDAGIEVGISKGFLFATPYAGAGIIRSESNPQNISGLSSESYDQRKLFVGITLNIGFALTLEADRTGDIRTYSAKAGLRF